jgi:hypothetical protein
MNLTRMQGAGKRLLLTYHACSVSFTWLDFHGMVIFRDHRERGARGNAGTLGRFLARS